jgi:hypothetical protein
MTYENKILKLIAGTNTRKEIQRLFEYFDTHNIDVPKEYISTAFNKYYILPDDGSDSLPAKITEVIHESTAAKRARAIGLEKKPGWGLYGPPNKPATHRSFRGMLVRLRYPAYNRNLPKRRVVQYNQESSKIDYIAALIRDNNQTKNNGIKNIRATMSLVTQFYGRDSAPRVKPPNKSFRRYVEQHNEVPLGIYNRTEDAIEILDEYLKFPTTPISQWTAHDIESFSTRLHETLHSTSARLKTKFYKGALNIAIEEGLTEYIASGITAQLIGEESMRANFDQTYTKEVYAIELMANYGNLDVDDAFRDSEVLETGQFSVVKKVLTAQNTAVQHILKEIAQLDSTFISQLSTRMFLEARYNVLSMCNPKFLNVLLRILSNPENARQNQTSIQEQITDIFDL